MRELGCDLAQGFLFAQPVPAERSARCSPRRGARPTRTAAAARHRRLTPQLRGPVTIRRWSGRCTISGGRPTGEPIDRTEHELEDWELLADALVGALGRAGVMNVDELRRGIESMPPAEYERASYYERWLFSVETILTEKGVLAPGELEARL